jgi:hypothetical protein
MPSGRDEYRSSYATFTARERELERSRARRDAQEAATAAEPPDAAPPRAGASVPARQ